MPRSDEILNFWFGPPQESDYGQPRKYWFEKSAAFDEVVRRQYGVDYELAVSGSLDHMRSSPRSSLALIILFDQFPRNMFRDDPRAYATDPKARDVARWAVDSKYDHSLLPVERWFMYLPFGHSEDIADQRRSVELFRRLPQDPVNAKALESAIRHFDIVQRFGRFPHRNAVLGRDTTPEEAAFLMEPDSSF